MTAKAKPGKPGKAKRLAVFNPPLAAPINRWFGKLRPMEPRTREEPFDNPRYYFQIKWDGIRILAFVDKGEVRLQNRRGRERTFQYPELQELGGRLENRVAILDGEVIIMEKGKPNFPRVMQRDSCSREQVLAHLLPVHPVTYCIFDLLFLDGEDLTSRPYCYRQSRLVSLIKESFGAVYLNENFDSGKSLYRWMAERGWEGVVAKEKTGRYTWGPNKSSGWFKIKVRRQQLCLVGGLSRAEGAPAALLLGVYRDGEITYIGKAGSGLTRQDLLELDRLADRSLQAEPCFVNPPREKGLVWLKPDLTVLVEYAEWTANLRLRAPVIKGFTTQPVAEARL